jgi:hypothetical protein
MRRKVVLCRPPSAASSPTQNPLNHLASSRVAARGTSHAKPRPLRPLLAFRHGQVRYRERPGFATLCLPVRTRQADCARELLRAAPWRHAPRDTSAAELAVLGLQRSCPAAQTGRGCHLRRPSGDRRRRRAERCLPTLVAPESECALTRASANTSQDAAERRHSGSNAWPTEPQIKDARPTYTALTELTKPPC